jgi:hypothetical protein
MDNELLLQILKDLQEIKADIRWFKEREELRQQAIREATETAAKGLANVDPHHDFPTSWQTLDRSNPRCPKTRALSAPPHQGGRKQGRIDRLKSKTLIWRREERRDVQKAKDRSRLWWGQRQTNNNHPPIFAEKKKGPECYHWVANGDSWQKIGHQEKIKSKGTIQEVGDYDWGMISEDRWCGTHDADD